MPKKKLKPKARAAPGLTQKQQRFVVEYLKDQNATQAAIRAGYSEGTAKQQGSRLLTNADIAAEVNKGQRRVAKKAEVTVDTLAAELDEARRAAMKKNQSSAAVQATMGKAKLYGLGVEHRRLSGTLQVVNVTIEDLKGLTKDELDVLEAALPVLEKLGITGGDQGEEGAA
ncbi:terminase small subunit [Xanthomonas arboricola pv. juglandis]|uniref:terminase small subunit n=1 Tax=Xanthomonas arboricola TaxID=56448 RepID=UPI00069B1368|nr:terminase small subunit [Xanthomonas arboricola]MDN0220766.1 terminase small subunit [Xanthomonas arboricola pv. juglandis]MDN0225081.1 terminase small subunit [Xanthomonas arboricola pv. juglandis]MDN0229295.1 terminase small subunit [Xanthomonas arboricola pv. juglandis]MDN0233675.1 terminase small subunit [Xanthomonas arboricola pv. juglandis]MDN0237935.1 terminase small subunit [Xanthomonas arboricola pv. juglandis]